MQHPIETANYLLMLLGAVLIFSGPYIFYRTFKGLKEKRAQNPEVKFHWFNDTLNLIIAVLFFLAGILFIINNLKGNPLY